MSETAEVWDLFQANCYECNWDGMVTPDRWEAERDAENHVCKPEICELCHVKLSEHDYDTHVALTERWRKDPTAKIGDVRLARPASNPCFCGAEDLLDCAIVADPKLITHTKARCWAREKRPAPKDRPRRSLRAGRNGEN